MYCQKCGTQLPGDAVFCNKCGTPIKPIATIDKEGESMNLGDKMKLIKKLKQISEGMWIIIIGCITLLILFLLFFVYPYFLYH